MRQPGWDPRGKVFSIAVRGQTLGAGRRNLQVGRGYLRRQRRRRVFADPSASRIYKAGEDRTVTLFKDNSSGAKALRCGPDGRLYASQPARKRIVSYSPGGDEKVVAANTEANDLALTAKGEIYFTDTAHKRVGSIDGKGQKRIVYDGGEIALPTALALSPDQAMLVVADGQTRFSWSFQIAPDGSLINGEPFFRVEMPEVSAQSGVEGVMVDATGQVYFASAVGIPVCEQNGRCAQILSKPEFGTISSIAFGGKDLDWIYVTEGGKLYRRQSKQAGVTP